MKGQIAGQMNIFDFMSSMEEKKGAKMKPGTAVYLVHMGDIHQFQVEEGSYISMGERRYWLIDKEGIHSNISENGIGVNAFLTEKEAQERAEDFLCAHPSVIRATDIHAVGDVVAYGYLREGDGRKMISFYCGIGGGKYYVKGFMTYCHITTEEGLREFWNQGDFKYRDPKRIQYQPRFKNMYPMDGDKEWLYAEAGRFMSGRKI